MLLHELIDQLKIADLYVFRLIDLLVDLVDKVYWKAEIFFDGILRNHFSVFDLFVIQQSLAELYVLLAPFFKQLERGRNYSKVFLGKQSDDLLISVHKIENLWDSSHFSQSYKDIRLNIAQNVDQDGGVQLLDSLSWLFHVLKIERFFI